ncbi:MAG TPA: glucans biosynthesis glucosyltransferase MdoH [Rhodanobacteraceae bacterium]
MADPSTLPPITPPLNRASLPYARRHRYTDRLRARWRWAARRRRTLFVVLVAAQVLIATNYMVDVLPYHASTPIEMGFLVTFALSFAWVTIGAWLGIYGFFYRLIGGDPRRLCRTVPPEGVPEHGSRTALVMPIYHESIDACFAGVAAVYQQLRDAGQLDGFDFYVLSDSHDEAIVQAERAAWARWVVALDAGGRFFYRHRKVHLRHKSGNIADFLRRWGRNYDYFLILDADSLMAAATLTRMVRVMDAYPRVGILQAGPRIVGAKSRFARLQQFANALYGPLFSTGLAALQLGDGAYWGHNAIIRTYAFMRHCALPSLHGIGLFRGPILSHDFVEATYMRRGGYEVWLETDLDGSYEQSPPSLVDELARDRRWARGNLQHLPIMLSEGGLGVPQRLIFMNGVLAYAAAPLWLVFLIFAGLEVAQFTLFPINYFPTGHQLFPHWPQWHPQWAIGLAIATGAVLFVPKILSFLDALFRPSLRRAFGGGWRLATSTCVEVIASVLLAPTRMLAHSRFVAEALLGLQLRWAGQHRSGAIGWGTALAMHGVGALIGIAWAIFAWRLRPMYFYWSLPVALPLVLAPAVAVFTSRVGRRADAPNALLRTPVEPPPAVLRAWMRNLAPADAPLSVDAAAAGHPAPVAGAPGQARGSGTS